MRMTRTTNRRRADSKWPIADGRIEGRQLVQPSHRLSDRPKALSLYLNRYGCILMSREEHMAYR